jgi:ribosomal protein S21
VSELKRKKNEAFESFMRRVKQQWQKSGKILQVRKIQYFAPNKSKNEQKKQAVNHSKMVSKKEYLQKIGKLPVDDLKK